MSLLRNKFNIPLARPSRQLSRQHQILIKPTLGHRASEPKIHIRPGESANMYNVMVEDESMQPRSGLSRFDTASGPGGGSAGLLSDDVPLYECLVSGRTQDDMLFVVSSGTIIQLDPRTSTSGWTVVPGPTFLSSATKGGQFEATYDHAEVWSETEGQKYAILTQWLEPPKRIPINRTTPGTASYISSFLSVTSYAQHCAIFDERLIFFRERPEGGSNRDYRIRWSVRGSFFSFQEVGSSFQDLEAMHGVPAGLITDVNSLLLFTTEQVWKATARRDSFAFDFAILHPTVGCAVPHTLQQTHAGPIFLAKDHQFHLIRGGQAVRIGGKIRHDLNETLDELKVAFSVYHPDKKHYCFFYSDTSNRYPERALVLDVDTISEQPDGTIDGNWFPWNLPRQVSAGAVARTYNAHLPEQSRLLCVSEASARHMVFMSSQTMDDTSEIECSWETHLLNVGNDLRTLEELIEVSLHYSPRPIGASSPSTISIEWSPDPTFTSTYLTPITLSTSSRQVSQPVNSPSGKYPVARFYWRPSAPRNPKIGLIQLTLKSRSGTRDFREG